MAGAASASWQHGSTDTRAAKPAAHASRHLPRLEELLPRETARLADGAAEGSEQRRPFEAAEIAPGQAVGGSAGEGGGRHRVGLNIETSMPRRTLLFRL